MRECALWFQTARRAGSGSAASTAATAATATNAILPPATVAAASAGPVRAAMKVTLNPLHYCRSSFTCRTRCCVVNPLVLLWSQNVLQARLVPTAASNATVGTTAPVTG